MILTEQISEIVRPLVLSGIYKNEKLALKDIVLDYLLKKSQNYKLTILKFQSKYELNFKDFSEKIKNNAKMQEEEDWMDWKAAIEMNEAWNNAATMIIKDAN